MADYYIDERACSNGEHEVHRAGCRRLPAEHARRYLGDYPNARAAVHYARRVHATANGCVFCSAECCRAG